MNTVNMLSALSGSMSSEVFDRFLQGDNKDNGDFSATLMAQFGLLAQFGSKENPTLTLQKSTELNGLDSELLSSVQEIAALIGNHLPITAHTEQEIDLEKTMKTLNEVLAHIEAINTDYTIDGFHRGLSVESTLISAPAEKDKDADSSMLSSVSSDNEESITPTATMMPLLMIQVSDEAEKMLAVDGYMRSHLDLSDSEIGMVDQGRSAPELIKNLMQKAEELSHGKSLIKDQPDVSEHKPLIEGKSPALQSNTETKSSSSEKKIASLVDTDKPVPKVALDMAQLHRQIAGQTKAELAEMSKPMTHPEWKSELGERIVWMSSRAISFAELKLNPQHLGPISIRIDMNESNQASIAFSAQHASVKEAIEAAIPKLREMMMAQQLIVADINVTQGSANDQSKLPGFGQATQQQNENGRKNSQGGTAFDGSDNTSNNSEDIDNAVVRSGIVNIFA